jgi:hypothetical protein
VAKAKRSLVPKRIRERNDFSANTKRIMALRVAWRCSNPVCRVQTTGPNAQSDKAVSIGIAAHITAASIGGPRYELAMSKQERGSLSNGIWLCSICAGLFDKDRTRFSPELLRLWREDAEQRAALELGRPTITAEAARFGSIVLDSRCMWGPSHRLGKIAAFRKLRPEIGFHALLEATWQDRQMSTETHSVDPILDLTLVNDTTSNAILSHVGFEAHSVWSDLKGWPQSSTINVLAKYAFDVSPIVAGDSQFLQLPDPIRMPPGEPARVQIELVRFRENLPGNESLLRLLAVANGSVHRSRLINFGVY